MSHKQPAHEEAPAQGVVSHAQDDLSTDDTVVQSPEIGAHEPVEEQDEWYDGPTEGELPPRPRRRLLTPIPLVLLGVLLTACGFIGGVLVEKGESPSAASASSANVASRFAALRSGTSSGTVGATGNARGATGPSAAGAFGASGSTAVGGSGRGASATIGQVAYISGHTLYVTNLEGNTVKVTTSVASNVTKTIKTDIKGIHPGEMVIVTGSPGTNGAVSAETIRVGEASGSGLGALFGGGGSQGTRSTRRGGSGEPTLFGG